MGFEAILANIKSTGIFVAVLSILIIVHEWGHYITARKLGVKVEKFALGFGPKLFSKIHDGTEFLVCLIPLGGYVKMAGDIREECKGAPEEFFSKSPGQRALIVLNGPVVNFALAYVCLFFVFLFGYPDMPSKVGDLVKDYPAQVAGLQKDDEILEVNHKKVSNWTELQSAISQSTTPIVELTLLRDHQPMELEITPRDEKIKNIFGQTKETRIVGIRPSEGIVLLKYSIGESLVKSFEKIVEITLLTYKSLYFMVTGSMSAKESMTGPIGIFYIIKTAAEMGFTHLLFILGVISASLAIFNLLPVIPLDGGHLFFLGVDKIRGKSLPLKID